MSEFIILIITSWSRYIYCLWHASISFWIFNEKSRRLIFWVWAIRLVCSRAWWIISVTIIRLPFYSKFGSWFSEIGIILMITTWSYYLGSWFTWIQSAIFLSLTHFKAFYSIFNNLIINFIISWSWVSILILLFWNLPHSITGSMFYRFTVIRPWT